MSEVKVTVRGSFAPNVTFYTDMLFVHGDRTKMLKSILHDWGRITGISGYENLAQDAIAKDVSDEKGNEKYFSWIVTNPITGSQSLFYIERDRVPD